MLQKVFRGTWPRTLDLFSKMEGGCGPKKSSSQNTTTKGKMKMNVIGRRAMIDKILLPARKERIMAGIKLEICERD